MPRKDHGDLLDSIAYSILVDRLVGPNLMLVLGDVQTTQGVREGVDESVFTNDLSLLLDGFDLIDLVVNA